MNNLLKNWRWLEGDCNAPKCFCLTDGTYDNLCLCGCRTCSFTRDNCSNMKAILKCKQLIPANCCRKICFGLTIRAAEADCLMLVAEFIDCKGVVISIDKKDITRCVCPCFRQIMQEFCIPCGTKCIRLSVMSKGRLTACTCFAPFAFFTC